MAIVEGEPIPLFNRKETILGVSIAMSCLSGSAIALRLYTRLKILKKPGFDDLFIALTAVFAGLGTVYVVLAAYNGMGEHVATLGQKGFEKYLFRFYILNACYTLNTALLKISLLCQYLRVFEQGIMRKVCIGMLCFCAVWGCAVAFMAWVPCFPVRAYWTLSMTNATCYGYGSKDKLPFIRAYVSHSALNLVLDLLILVLPSPVLWRRALSKKEKFAACGLGLMGSLVISMRAWRTGDVVVHQAGFKPYVDWTWWSSKDVLLGALEIHLAILAVSVPVFWPIIEAHFYGIVVREEIEVTSHPISHYENQYYQMGDGDSKSDHGSETGLASRRPKSPGFYTEEIAMGSVSKYQHNVKVGGARKGSHTSWLDTN